MSDDACRHKCQPHTSLSGGCRHVPGNFGLEFRKFGKNQINDGPANIAFVGSTETKYFPTELNFGDFGAKASYSGVQATRLPLQIPDQTSN